MIGGNKDGVFQILQTDTTTRNEFGERVPVWTDVQAIKGFLDMSNGDSKRTSFNAKIQESTHIFIADYVPLDASIEAENSRMVVDGKRYDVMLIDDPMELHKQLEIYLKYTGGQ